MSNTLPLHFEPVEQLEEAFRMIAEGAKNLAPTLIWTSDQGYMFESKITQLSGTERALFCWKPHGFESQKFAAEIKNKGADCFFSVTLDKATLFFKCQILEEGASSLRFNIPLKFFKVQRRKNMRQFVFKDPKVWAQFQDPLFPENTLKKKVYDISVGGLAFLVVTPDAPMFAPGLDLTDFQFTLKDRIIKTSAEILHTKPLKGDQKGLGVKVGVKFKGILPSDVDFINEFVSEESRKIFSRFS